MELTATSSETSGPAKAESADGHQKETETVYATIYNHIGEKTWELTISTPDGEVLREFDVAGDALNYLVSWCAGRGLYFSFVDTLVKKLRDGAKGAHPAFVDVDD